MGPAEGAAALAASAASLVVGLLAMWVGAPKRWSPRGEPVDVPPDPLLSLAGMLLIMAGAAGTGAAVGLAL